MTKESKKYYCPKCGKEAKKEFVSAGYFRACKFCDEDFYKFELKTK